MESSSRVRGRVGRWFGAAVVFGLACFASEGLGQEAVNPSPGVPDEGAPPNIVFVLCDDLGFGDLGVLFQNERTEDRRLHTPHIDRLSGEGTLLTRHYCPAPVCAPSRASLMLGQHQGHAGIRDNQFDKALPRDHNLASLLKGAGYRTALVGKWGLQGKGDSPSSWPAYPTKVGFDEFFGYVRHRDGHSHYPAHATKARKEMELYDGDSEVSAALTGCYTTDLFTARAKKVLVEHAGAEDSGPLFLLLAYDTPHAALHIPSAPYPEGRGVQGGLQWLGTPGKMISTAVEPVDAWLHPDYASRDWTESEKRFATMVRRIDDCVGDLVATIDELGMGENTLFVLTSDNGPHKEAYTPGRRYGADRFDSFGPLDGIKRDVYEGGIRVPTLVRWPGVAQAGERCAEPSQFHDWMATFAEAAQVPAPLACDGRSLRADLVGGERVGPPSTVYVEYVAGGKTPPYLEFLEGRRGGKRGQMQALYLDGYKGVRTNIQSHADRFQIYDTLEDPGERKNLADSSDAFRRLEVRMRARVLQLHGSNQSAKRPYDGEVLSAEAKRATSQGLLRVERDGGALGMTGFLDVPASGPWTFRVESKDEAVLRVGGALAVDADYGPRMDRASGTVFLEKGLHGVELSWRGASGGEPRILWSGPGQEVQAVPVERLLHGDDGVNALGEAAFPAPLAPRIEQLLGEEFQRQGLVGLAAAAVRGGEILPFYLGHEDREAGVPVTAATRFRWASISKPLTAIAAMRLVEEGALGLDESVRTYVPEFPQKRWSMTTRQLLQHRGGVVHYRNGLVLPKQDAVYELDHPFVDTVTALDRFSASPLIFEPGTKHAYTTHGYMLAGAVVQRAARRPYRSVIRETIAVPLGMTSLRPDYEWEAIDHRAAGYARRAGEVRRVSSSDVSWKLPGGGYLSTLEDLARFADGVCQRRILKAESWDAMWTPQEAPESEGGVINYGLGFGIKLETAPGLRVSHSGAQGKTRTLMRVFPDAGYAVVLMTNSEWADLSPIAQGMEDALADLGER